LIEIEVRAALSSSVVNSKVFIGKPADKKYLSEPPTGLDAETGRTGEGVSVGRGGETGGDLINYRH